jgi:two-component system NtrC family sensor kinase
MPHHIFLIDDEEAVRLILTDLFESRGYRITEAVDGAAALEQLKNTSDEDTPDLILADYQMPNLNGVDFLVAAHDICPQAVRILLTAHGDLEVAVNAINEARVYKFITKPWNNRNLLITVQRALEHYDLIRENRAFADMLEMMVEESSDEMGRLRDALKDMAARIRRLID